jgi:hypothetical protein
MSLGMCAHAAEVPQDAKPDGKVAAQSPASGWQPKQSVIGSWRKRRAAGVNFDESRVPDYKLPDPLVSEDGRPVKNFPHWFCERFKAYGGRESELPVDQHEWIALIAPRAVYVASADEDLWADPRGENASLIAAGPVFELFGLKHITESAMPPLNSPRHVGATGYHIRTGVHNLTEQDWGYFLDFADGVFE